MAAPDDLTDDENWSGGFYELMLFLGPDGADRIDPAVRSLWAAADVRGCRARYAGIDVEVGAAALAEYGHLAGTLRLPSGERVVCGALGGDYDGITMVQLYLPLGALSRADRRVGAYPFGGDSGGLDWRAPLDRWLADIAVAVHADVPYQRALIGFEIDEDKDLTPSRRWAAVLTPGPDGFDYLPATD